MSVSIRNGVQNAIYDPDRDARSNMSDRHYHHLMQQWGYNDPVENDERIVQNRYIHTDFFYGDGNTSVQKKCIKDCGYDTITIPAHCWNDNTPFAELLFHGYYADSNPRQLVRAVLIDVSVLKGIKPCGKRRNYYTGTDFYHWDYGRVEEAITHRFNVAEAWW
jgi:hypothetical protein